MRRHLALGGLIAALSAIAVLRRRCLIVNVRGSSMTPRYHDGDVLLAVRPLASHRWRPGEDLVFARTGQSALPPGEPAYLVKRICAVPGDPLPAQLAGTITDRDHRGLIPQSLLVLRGINETGTRPFFYPVPVRSVAGKVICRLRRAGPAPADLAQDTPAPRAPVDRSLQ